MSMIESKIHLNALIQKPISIYPFDFRIWFAFVFMNPEINFNILPENRVNIVRQHRLKMYFHDLENSPENNDIDLMIRRYADLIQYFQFLLFAFIRLMWLMLHWYSLLACSNDSDFIYHNVYFHIKLKNFQT